MVKSFRVAAYAAYENTYHYRNLHYGATIEDAIEALNELLGEQRDAWIEVSKKRKMDQNMNIKQKRRPNRTFFQFWQ